MASTILTNEAKEEINELKKGFPNNQAVLMNALRVLERVEGRISDDGINELADFLDVSSSHIKGMVTFYTHFNRPTHGKYRIMVCSTLMCAMMGSFNLVEHLEKRLNIKVGECTPDGKFSIEKVECLADCGNAPVMQINNDHYNRLTPEKVDEILKNLE